MDRADIPIEVALSIVLAAAVDGADRRGLLTALSGPRPVLEGLPRPRPGGDEGADPDLPEPDGDGAPALVFAFPAPDEPDPDGPAAA
jgi:hypothetical protein